MYGAIVPKSTRRGKSTEEIDDELMRQGRSSICRSPGLQTRSSTDPGREMPEPVAEQQHAAKSKADVALAECLQLLKGPTDERR